MEAPGPPDPGAPGMGTEAVPVLPWNWEGSFGVSSPLEAPGARGQGVRTRAWVMAVLCASPTPWPVPAPVGLQPLGTHSLFSGSGHPISGAP